MKKILFLLLALAAGPSPAAEPAPPTAALRAEMAQRWPEALALYQQALRAEPRRADLWLRMADIYATLKQPLDAARATAEAARLRPQDHALLLRLSRAHAIANQPAAALAAIREAVALQPGQLDYLRAQAELAAWNGDLALAESSQRAVLAQQPGDAPAQRQLARLQLRAGQIDRAAQSYADYRRQHPQDLKALLEAADVETYRGDFAAAADLLQTYRARAGETADWRRHQSGLLARAGRPDAAQALLAPLLQNSPDDYELRLLHTLALHGDRQTGATRQELGQLRRLGPQRPETHGTTLLVETPQRPYFGGGIEYYSDSIPLSVLHTRLEGALGGSGRARLSLQANDWDLRTDAGSGYETPSGDLHGSIRDVWLLAELQPQPQWSLQLGAGAVSFSADAADRLLGRAGLQWRASDRVDLALAYRQQPVAVSPRAAALGIVHSEHQLHLEWRPSYTTTLDLRLARDRYSDGNVREQFDLAPRWALLRREGYNLDLGFSAQLLRYAERSSNGYYAPEHFQRYWAMAYYYLKGDENHGLSLVLGAGPERDRQLDTSFQLGGNLYAEGIFGVYQDWQLRAYGGYGSRVDGARDGSATPHGYSAGVQLIRRF